MECLLPGSSCALAARLKVPAKFTVFSFFVTIAPNLAKIKSLSGGNVGPSHAAPGAGVDDAAALRAVLTPAAAAHRCVAPVAAMARAARTGYPPGEHTPPGCEGVLRRGGDWERDLKAWIERWSAAKSRL